VNALPRRRQLVGWAVALIGMIAWQLSRPSGINGAHAWLGQHLQWLLRLLDRYLVLIALAACWETLRAPRSHPAALVLGVFVVALNVLELPLNLFLGSMLALLVAVAAVARPRPNRVIIGRCIVLAGLAIALDAFAH